MFKKKEMKIKLHLQIISKFNLQKIDTENSFSRQFEAQFRKKRVYKKKLFCLRFGGC